VIFRRPEHEQAAPNLHCGKRYSEGHGAILERLGYRGGQQQPRQHQREQEQTHRAAVGIEPVGDPCSVDPRPPHRQHQKRELHRSERRQVFEQAVRELGDGKDEHQVKKQLDVGDAMVFVSRLGSQMVGARSERVRVARISRH
jgi:hypothetical protein